MELLIDFLAVAVVPAVILSFWRFSQRDEYTDLRATGQKLNLNMHNLRAGFNRRADDPVRESHIKLAKIGFLHWLCVPLGFLFVLVFGMIIL